MNNILSDRKNYNSTSSGTIGVLPCTTTASNIVQPNINVLCIISTFYTKENTKFQCKSHSL